MRSASILNIAVEHCSPPRYSLSRWASARVRPLLRPGCPLGQSSGKTGEAGTVGVPPCVENAPGGGVMVEETVDAVEVGSAPRPPLHSDTVGRTGRHRVHRHSCGQSNFSEDDYFCRKNDTLPFC